MMELCIITSRMCGMVPDFITGYGSEPSGTLMIGIIITITGILIITMGVDIIMAAAAIMAAVAIMAAGVDTTAAVDMAAAIKDYTARD